MPLDAKDNMPDGQMKYKAAYPASASVEVDSSWDVQVNAAFTYWYAGQDAMDVAYYPSVESTTGGVSGAVVYQQFGYAPGFQVGVGIDTHFDDWTLDAEYTWYNKTQSKTVAPPIGEFFSESTWAVPFDTYSGDTVFSSWKLALNQLDVEVGRPSYHGKKVVLFPVGGVRFLWLNQNLNIVLPSIGVDIATFTSSSSSWAVGPKIGVNHYWHIWNGLRIDGILSGSVLYTRYTTITVSQATEDLAGVLESSATSSTSDQGAIRPSVEMGLGLGYGDYYFNNTFYLDLSIRYDFMQFWSQNMMRKFATQLSGLDNGIGDLRLHGLTIDLRCDF